MVKRNVTTDATKYTSKEGSTIPTPASYDGATFKGWSGRPNVVEARYFNATAVAVLYAYYQKTITVSYDKNDGTGTIAPASGPKTYISKAVSTDASVALTTLNPSITVSDGSGFTRTGYVFSGWNTKADGTGKNYAKSEKAEFSESTTLYAKWTAIGYNISYNLQNGTAGTNKPTTAKYDQVVTISNPTKTVTITGDANGTGATITGSPVSKPQTFAGWTYSGGNTATALYGTASNAVTTSWNNASTKVKAEYFKNLTATNNATVTMKANWTTAAITLPKATKTGYTVKWYKNTAGTGTAYASGSSYSPAEGDPANITFYAKATANKYKVVYNNGDANSGTLPSNQDVYYDGNVTLGTNNMKKNNTSGYTVTYIQGPATGGTLPGVQNQVVSYTANGWATSQNGSRVYTNGQTISPYKINGNLNLYPSWTETRGTITLATNNMTKSNKTMGKITFNYNGSGQAATTAYAYTQFTANGWLDNDKTYYTNGKVITPSSNLTLTPNFTSAAKSPAFPTPTREGYVFAGWYDGKGSDAKKYTSYNGKDDITLYAHWTEKYILITFYSNGATNVGSAENAGLSSDETKSTIRTTITWTNRTGVNLWNCTSLFSRTGYAIPSDAQAWILGSPITGLYINQATQDFTNYFDESNVKTEISLYANWQLINYTISYDLDNGSFSSKPPTSYNITSNTVTLLTPTREGYTFTGWTGSNGTTKQKTVTIPKGSTGNKNYTANWTANTYKVTLDSNGGDRYDGITFNVTYGGVYSPLNAFTSSSRTGYVFDGWYTAKSGGTKITSSSTVSTSNDHTLHAHWTEKHILITYYSNGATQVGSAENAGLSSDETKSTIRTTITWTNRNRHKNSDGTYGEGVNLWNCTSLFSRPGYHTPSDAKAWLYKSADSKIYINQAKQDFTDYFDSGVETKISLYANWEAHTYGTYKYYDNTHHRKTCTVCGATASAKHTAGASCGSEYLIIGTLKSETSERYIYKSKCENYSNCGGTVDYYRKTKDGKLSTGTRMKYSKFIDANGNLAGVESCPRRKCTVCGGWYTP